MKKDIKLHIILNVIQNYFIDKLCILIIKINEMTIKINLNINNRYVQTTSFRIQCC